MKLTLAAACALATLSLAGTAFADAHINATLETPKTARTKMIAAHAVFVCDQSACIAGVAPDSAYTVAACKEVARRVGRLTAYTNDRRAFTAEQLDACNAAAPAPAATAAAAD